MSSTSTFDRIRIWWTSQHYGLWLDLYFVPRRHRKALQAEFESNLTDASANVGFTSAAASLGSLRHLAASTSAAGIPRSRWYAGFVGGLTSFVVLMIAFLLLSLYYTEGVVDAGATQPVSSTLFPFVWSDITVDPTEGLAFSAEPGPLPVVVGVAVWLLIASPWKSRRRPIATAG